MEKTRETLRTFVAETSGRPWIAYSAVIACLLTLCLVVNKKFDSWAFGLVVLGSAPWLAPIFETLKVKDWLEVTVRQNSSDIRTITAVLLRSTLERRQREILTALRNNEPVTVDTAAPQQFYENGNKKDLLRLRGLGFIRNRSGHSGFSEMETDPRGERDATIFFEITDEGRRFLDLEQSARGDYA